MPLYGMIDDFYCIFVILILDNQILDYTFIGLSHHHKINNKYVLFFNNRETELKKKVEIVKIREAEAILLYKRIIKLLYIF